MTRAHIPLQTKLAATLLALGHIPHDDARLMSAGMICSLYHFDHDPIPKAEDGPDEPWNLTPRLITQHREKTAKVDVPGIAKRKRVAAKQEQHSERMQAKLTGEAPSERRPRSRKLQSRGFQKIHKPLRSRNDLRRRERR
jgi:hypothetical protein